MDLQEYIIQKLGGYDKSTHFFASAWIYMLMPTWLYALITAIILAISKELIDKYIRKTEFSIKDMIFTFIGGLLSTGIIFIKTLI